MMENLKFRWATAGDRAAVVSISGSVYQGLDYLNEKFNAMIEDPDFYGLIGEIDGEAVAFGGAFILKDRKKIITKAGRVKVEWRDRGVYGRLQSILQAEIKSLYPTLKTREFFTGGNNPAMEKLRRNGIYEEIFKRTLLLFKQPPSDPQPLDVPATDIGCTGLQKLFESSEKRKSIFPGDRVFFLWELYNADVGAVESISKEKHLVLYTDSRGMDVLTIGGSYVSNSDGLIYVIQCHTPCFADVTCVEEALLAHVSGHVTSARARAVDRCTLVFVGENNHANALEEACLKHGLEKIQFFEGSLIGYAHDIY